MKALTAGLAGLIFGLGLILSGMSDPTKVLAFLDLAGAWDPSLALVMGGAIAVGLVGFGLAGQRQQALSGDSMRIAPRAEIDRHLIAGSLVFGVGWGLAGFCPGPAVVGLPIAFGKTVWFVGAMLVGMAAFGWIARRVSSGQVRAGG